MVLIAIALIQVGITVITHSYIVIIRRWKLLEIRSRRNIKLCSLSWYEKLKVLKTCSKW